MRLDKSRINGAAENQNEKNANGIEKLKSAENIKKKKTARGKINEHGDKTSTQQHLRASRDETRSNAAAHTLLSAVWLQIAGACRRAGSRKHNGKIIMLARARICTIVAKNGVFSRYRLDMAWREHDVS